MAFDTKRLQTCLPDVKLYAFDEIDSTSLFAKRLMDETHQPMSKVPALILANQQSNGYGRRDRQFYSPADVGVYMTMLVPMTENQLHEPGTMTLNLAVAVQQVVQNQLGVNLAIKWVNDLYQGQRKVTGILVEMLQMPTPQMQGIAAIGIGINLNPTAFTNELQAKAGAITSAKVDREGLVAQLFEACLQKLTLPFSAVRDYYLDHSLVLNQTVELVRGKQTIQGRVVDIDTEGRLVLISQQQRYQFSAGEITKVNLT